MKASSLPDLDEDDYLQLEDALMQTERGRAFLRMRDRRMRVVSVAEWSRLTDRLEAQVKRLEGPLPSAAPTTSVQQLESGIREIAASIKQASSEISSLKAVDTGSNRIEAATGELDAIVVATEKATTVILAATEQLLAALTDARRAQSRDQLNASLDAAEAQCIEIMMACSFQDITGQRTSKVVNTLRYIEERVNTMIEIWGVSRAGLAVPMQEQTVSHRKLNDERPDADLLNGPALSDGMDQTDIDSLLANMDVPAGVFPDEDQTDSPDAGGDNGGGSDAQSTIDALFR